MRVMLILFLLIVPSMAKADSNECRRLSGKAESVTLLPASQSPAFYFYSQSYFIFFKADDVLSYLSLQPQRGMMKPFMKSLSADIPLRRNIDLYSYVSTDSSIAGVIDALVADLLQQGKATVFHVGEIWPGSGKPLESIKVYKAEGRISGWRFFCTKDKETIYALMDWIS